MLLNCHTHYSFCYGIFSIEELFNRISNAGYHNFVLTDINNTSACIDTIRIAKQRGLKPIVGIDFRNEAQQQYVGIARNNQGFQELNIHLSNHLHSKQAFDAIAPNFNHCYIIYPLEQYNGFQLRDHEFVGVSIKNLPHLAFIPAYRKTSKLVILQTVSFANKQQFNAHRLLRAIDTNTLLSKLPKTQQATGDEMLLPSSILKEAFKHYPDIISRTEAILNDCSIDFEFGKLSNKNLKFYTDSHANDIALLRRECMHGLAYRYPNPSQQVLERIEKRN